MTSANLTIGTYYLVMMNGSLTEIQVTNMVTGLDGLIYINLGNQWLSSLEFDSTISIKYPWVGSPE
jgi:hypothetical protein